MALPVVVVAGQGQGGWVVIRSVLHVASELPASVSVCVCVSECVSVRLAGLMDLVIYA